MAACAAIFLAVFPNVLSTAVSWCIIGLTAIGMLIGIIFLIYGKRLPAKERRKSAVIRKKSKEIDSVLSTVEAIGNHLYNLLPDIERKPLNKLEIETIFNTRNILYVFAAMLLPFLKPQELISTLMDDNNIGVANALESEIYQELNQKLEKQLRLKSINFRNAVYNHIRSWHTMYNFMLYSRRYKKLKKGHVGLLNSYWLRQLENTYTQGIGNSLTSLALKLAEEDRNE